MTQWRATAALGRAAAGGRERAGPRGALRGPGPGRADRAASGSCAALGLLHRPTREPRAHSVLAHPCCTRVRAPRRGWCCADVDDVEHVTRVTSRAPYLALRPAHGTVGSLLDADGPGRRHSQVSPRRWGRRMLGEEKVALTTRWAGYRWGPVALTGDLMRCCPRPRPSTPARSCPSPSGWSGRTARAGSGTAPSSPASGPSTPATGCGASTGGSPCAADELHVVTPGPRRTRRARGGRRAVRLRRLRAASTVRPAASTCRCGPRPPSPSTTAGPATASACGWWAPRARWSATAPAPGTCGSSSVSSPGSGRARRSTSADRPLALPGHRRDGGDGAVADAERGMTSSAAAPDAPRTARDGDRHAAGRRESRRRARACAPSWPTWPGGCGASSGTSSSTGSPAPAVPVVTWRGPGTLDEVLRRLARRSQLPQVAAR